jgi:hypothetical protein
LKNIVDFCSKNAATVVLNVNSESKLANYLQ